MLLRHLHYLVALASERHFARAAERCSISQPALSLAVKHLESELGVPIVQRGNRFQGFTAEGERVLLWARRVLDDESTLKQELHQFGGELHGTLRIGVIPSATAIGAFVVTSFARRNPGVTISDLELNSNHILRAIEAFELDAGITYVDDDEPLEHVRTFELGVERYALVTPDDSPFAGAATVSWKDAAELPLCLLHRDMQNRRILDRAFESVGARANARVETNSLLATHCYLRSGYWSTIMPVSHIELLAPPPNMQVIPLVEPEVCKAVGLVVSDRRPLSPLLDAFCRHAAHLEDRVPPNVANDRVPARLSSRRMDETNPKRLT